MGPRMSPHVPVELHCWLARAVSRSWAGLILWTAYLAWSLHRHFQAHNWRRAWVGFDAALIVVLAHDVDVIVIGAGGEGYPGAFVLDKAGRRVVMVDPIGNLGGDCLAEGCVPSKAGREASVVRARARCQGRFGDLIIATGLATSRLAIPGAELALTSQELLRLGADIALPRRPVINAGGCIASMLDARRSMLVVRRR